jgi:OFA family oxalate/formate antiporter-like MFS transporter
LLLNRSTQILIASMLVTLVLGSVHAFSVFLAPLEVQLGLPRSQISLIYSFALVAITLSVTVGYRIYASLPAWWLILITAAVAASGLLLAAAADSWWMLFAGYSLAFGISNGIGYGFCLQLVGRAMPARKGFAMGAVTAAYAVGSIVFAKVIAWRIEVDSVAAAFVAIAFALAVIVIGAAFMLYRADACYGESVTTDRGDDRLDRCRLLQFWFAYLTGVFAGLMAIGHAAGIAQSRGADVELATATAMTVGIGSASGGFIAGWLVDRWPLTRFLVALPLLSAVALLAIAVITNAHATLLLLGLVGFAYGSIIAIYPVAISNVFLKQGPQAYGRVFIAWGFAGLVAPWTAGILYDWQAGYELSMLIAALVALVSAISAGWFKLGKVG